MAWIELSRISLVTTGEFMVSILVASVEGGMFSFYMDSFSVEGYIIRNKVDGLVEC